MSTNNNRLGKEVHPEWKDEESKICGVKKLSTAKLEKLWHPSTSADKITALSLSNRGICSIEDTNGMSSLKRLDISKNSIKRLSNMSSLTSLGMLNVSCNELTGGESIEDLRYMTELRTLNIGENAGIGRIKKHTLRSLPHLQALIAHECGLSSTEFLNKITSLSTLILSKNALESFPRLVDNSFYNLVKLSIGHNKFTTFPDLSFCQSMEELRINNNAIGSIPPSILKNTKLKTLDVSSNQLSSWESIELLTGLPNLTNLSAKSNPLPEPPAEADDFVLREDLSAEKIAFDESQLRYRRRVLSLFQIRVGKEQKLKVRLIVLDMKRVKAKWSHAMDIPVAYRIQGQKAVAPTGAVVSGDSYSAESRGMPVEKKKKKAKNPRTGQSDGTARAQVTSTLSQPPIAAARDEGTGEILGRKRKPSVSLEPPTGEAEISAVVSGGRKDRGEESGVVAVSVHNKKSKKPKTESTRRTGGKDEATKSVEDVLFGRPPVAVSDGWD